MSLSRLPLRASHVTAVACLVLAGCGGGDGKQSTPPSARQTSPSSTPPPTYNVRQIEASLLGPKDIAAGMARRPLTYPGLRQSRAPSCSDSAVAVPAGPDVILQQIEKAGSRYEGGHYIQFIAVYDDATLATKAYSAIQKHASACPAKRHFPAKRLPGNVVSHEHDDSWKLTRETVEDWTHIRGFQKRVIPPSSSLINVFYVVYDYAYRGNVVFSSVYWERVRPKVPGDRIAKRATELLTKQLQKID